MPLLASGGGRRGDNSDDKVWTSLFSLLLLHEMVIHMEHLVWKVRLYILSSKERSDLRIEA
jgi:hypothetical protein